MSIKAMDEVLNRMFLDKNFRNRLRRDPEKALSGYDLTPAERAAFLRLKKRRSGKNGDGPELSPANTGHLFYLN